MLQRLLTYFAIAGLCSYSIAQGQSDSKIDSKAEARERSLLHDRLRNSKGGLHDDYLLALAIGNEQTVPLLIDSLRRHYGATEPGPALSGRLGFVCTHVHLVDALRAITNNDQGMFYPRWQAWWEAHGALPRDVWVQSGFTQVGLHPGQPSDERFGLELIELMTDKRAYLTFNAKRLLEREPSELLAAWVGASVTSERTQRRLGALKLLVEIDKRWAEGLIRLLMADPDEEIRKLAIQAFGERCPSLPQ